ncbi:MAG: substrate-binding domain-containing protein, partial [Pseudomonadota bacterium]
MLRVTVFFVLFLVPAIAWAGDRMLIFAAASQKDALEEIGKLYEETCNCEIRYSFAATSTLARQIDAGAKVDVFISAN